MIYELLIQLSENELHLRKTSPYNVKSLFKDEYNLTRVDKKRICLLLDLLRSLVVMSQITSKNNELLLFGSDYSSLNETEFMEVLSENISKQNAFIQFLYDRMDNLKAMEFLLTQFDQNKLNKLFQDAKQ